MEWVINVFKKYKEKIWNYVGIGVGCYYCFYFKGGGDDLFM